MKERQRYTLPDPVRIQPGDRLICTVSDRKTGHIHEFQEKIGRTMTIDTVVTFDVNKETLGLKHGIGAIFGEATNGQRRTDQEGTR